jgi:riboflavin kinase/FMN adenylyltransferase
MRLSRHPLSFPFDRVANGSVATIGSFDGLHLGHQRLLQHVIAEARSRALPSIVMSFEPTPKEFFLAARPPARLMRFREKFEGLAETGVDIFFCPRFNEAMKNISADAFIRRILVHALNVRHLVIGDDFRFAQDREGHLDMLRAAGIALGFTVEQMSSVIEGDERVSSSAIRDALWEGDLERATALLGRHYRMSGKVIVGERVGRQLGYPTANVNLNRKQSAVMGIFAVRVSGPDWGPLDAVASIGTRPTFGGAKPLLEVHIFDFDKDIYGEYIHVDFIARLRSEEKFADVDQLVEQMHRDSALAREILAA